MEFPFVLAGWAHADDADGLLAAREFIRAQKQDVQLASYDERLVAAARHLGITEWSPAPS
jgi:hypothetical protein